MLTPTQAWPTWTPVWKAETPQDKWEDGMRTVFGSDWRLIPDQVHGDGEGGEILLASDTDIRVCRIMIRIRPHGKQEIRQAVKE